MELAIDQILQKGVAAHKAGKLEHAEGLYRAILNSQPNHPDANHNLGVLIVSSGKTYLAMSYFKRALEANPRVEQFWLSYIDALIELGMVDDARKILKQGKNIGLKGNKIDQLKKQLGVSLVPNVKSPSQKQLNGLVALYSQRKFQEALVQGKALEEKFPANPVIANFLGVVYAGLSEYTQSIIYYKKAIKLHPRFPEAYNNLGNAIRTLGNYQKSVHQYKKAISLNKNYTVAYFNLGNTFSYLGENEKALKKFFTAIILKPDYFNAYNDLSLTYKKLKLFEQAILSCERALTIKPHFVEGLNNLGVILTASRDTERAINVFNQAIQVKPDFMEAYNNLGNTLIDCLNFDEAAQNFLKAISLKPDFVEAYNNLGITFYKQGRAKEAIIHYKKANQLEPRFFKAYDNFGIALSDMRKHEVAVSRVKRALVLQPNYEDAYNNLGNMLLVDEQYKPAFKYLNQTTLINPQHSSARYIGNALKGDPIKKAPRDYVQDIFNQYASNFDEHLTGKLDYRVPKVLRQLFNQKRKLKIENYKTLDLGCGTGLSGLAFKDISRKLIGVDLSEGMIKEADKKNIYDELIHNDIFEALSLFKKNNELFDLFICTDVLIYIGDCLDLFTSVRAVAHTNSLFLFSTENKTGDGYSLLKTARYAHSFSYIQQCAKKCDLEILAFKNTPLRKQGYKTIDGCLFVLKTAPKEGS